MTVDDAHTKVQAALEGVDDPVYADCGLHELRLAELNETEREHATKALRALHDLDAALAERSAFEAVGDPASEDASGGDDEGGA